MSTPTDKWKALAEVATAIDTLSSIAEDVREEGRDAAALEDAVGALEDIETLLECRLGT